VVDDLTLECKMKKDFYYWLNCAKAVDVVNELTAKNYQYFMQCALDCMVGGKKWAA
jgi:hypothetical protein